jgi:hypothetical protein
MPNLGRCSDVRRYLIGMFGDALSSFPPHEPQVFAPGNFHHESSTVALPPQTAHRHTK